MLSLIRAFFAPEGRYPACGMFTAAHLLAAAGCLLLAFTLAMTVGRRMSGKTLRRLALAVAVVLTALELLKIGHAFFSGRPAPDAWIPLSFCSLFMASLWLYCFGRGLAQRAAAVYLTYAAPVAGLAFLVIPATSLMHYPIWHFLSVHSLSFHTLMLFFGLSLQLRAQRLDVRQYLSYAVLLLPCCLLATLLNHTLPANLMSLREPHNIPLAPVQWLYAAAPQLYPLCVTLVYLAFPLAVAALTGHLRRSGEEEASEEDSAPAQSQSL